MSETPENITHITGNAPSDVKVACARWMSLIRSRGNGFGDSIMAHLKVAEVSILPKNEEPSRLEVRVVLEGTVSEEMLNPVGSLHGGCAATLVDIGTSLPIAIYDLVQNNRGESGVSSALNVIYHSPAPLGSKLRIVNTTITVGTRIFSGKTEIWDATNQRLVASGTHTKMAPSPTKL